MLRKFTILAGVVAVALTVMVGEVYAADPLQVDLRQADIFRHVLEDDDWLVLARIHLVPEQSDEGARTDTFNNVTVSGGDFQDPITVTNRIIEANIDGEDDWTVTETGTSTDITSSCTLANDEQTIDCTGTGLADDTYTIAVDYRTGWDAYGGGAAFFRLRDTNTVVEQDTAPDVGYLLVGLYFTATEVTNNSLTWQDSNIDVQLVGSSALWDARDTDTVSSADITWHGTSTQDETQDELTTTLRNMLRRLESSDPAVDGGDYVAPEGITDNGQVIARDAFSRITRVIPDAFLTSRQNPFEDFSGGTTTYAD